SRSSQLGRRPPLYRTTTLSRAPEPLGPVSRLCDPFRCAIDQLPSVRPSGSGNPLRWQSRSRLVAPSSPIVGTMLDDLEPARICLLARERSVAVGERHGEGVELGLPEVEPRADAAAVGLPQIEHAPPAPPGDSLVLSVGRDGHGVGARETLDRVAVRRDDLNGEGAPLRIRVHQDLLGRSPWLGLEPSLLLS